VEEIKQDTINKLKGKYAGKQADRKEKEESPKGNVKPSGTAAPIAAAGDVTELQEKVNEQGNKVRELKSKKASKEDIDKEVKVLLQLKNDLAKAQGVDPSAAKDKKGKKK